jgi:hypothetical protein
MKKMLVAYDPKKADSPSSDFLVPAVEGGQFGLFGVKSKRLSALGMVVFVGREITGPDIFIRLAESGREISSAVESLNLIDQYLALLADLKIGTVVAVEMVLGDERDTYELRVVEVPRAHVAKPLP